MTLSHIFIYPIKSLAGISLSQAQLTDRGLQYDRRWLLVEPSGQFITQRQVPEMALLRLEQTDTGWSVSHKHGGLDPLDFPMIPESKEEMTVQVFKDRMPALTVSDSADAWFSAALDRPCRLVYMPEDSHRPVDPAYAKNKELVSFADGYPTMLLSQASLDHLNTKLEAPVLMDRFRPNLVIAGTEPHAEDAWTSFQLGEIRFSAVKPCSRCGVINIDQATAEKSLEPTQTLVGYRKHERKLKFGMNLLHEGEGTIEVGMALRF